MMNIINMGKVNKKRKESVPLSIINNKNFVFGIKSDGDTNLRVLLALAFRTHYGDKAFDQLNVPCSHMVVGPDGRSMCDRHID